MKSMLSTLFNFVLTLIFSSSKLKEHNEIQRLAEDEKY